MSATFDATTTGEYSAATTAAARSAVIVAALTGTISVKVFNGSNTEMGSGTMAAPWATASGDTVLIGEVTSFTVGTTATPDSNWYIRFQNAGVTRWVRGSFGLAGSGQDFTWSLDNWTATHTGTIGTATIITSGNAAPAFTVAPTSRSLPSSGGTIQFTAVDPEGVPVTYTGSVRTGFSTNPTTGLVTVTSAAAGTSGNYSVTASDGVLSTTVTSSVTVDTLAENRAYFAGASFEYDYLSPTPATIGETIAGVLSRKNGGANVLTLPITQSGTTAATSSTATNTSPIFRWGTNSLTDTHIVETETISEGVSTPDVVTPREGTYFWRQKIYRASGADYASPGTGVYPTKHYDQLNSSTVHTTDGSTCRPRNAMSFQKEAVYGFDRDAEVWMGFSLYIPTNWEHETYARGTTANGPMMLTLLPSSGNSLDTNSTHLTLNAIVPDSGWTALRQPTSGATRTHWCIQWYRNPTSTQEANVTRLSLGEIQLGKWTDFVLNMRWNPFTSNTTVLGTTYVGNAGKIRIWCGEQNSNGTRSISSGSPLYTYSGPCGNYPSGKIIPSLRVYMFGWNNANTSSRSHPVWVGADAFRWGFATGATVNAYQGGRASTWADVAPGLV